MKPCLPLIAGGLLAIIGCAGPAIRSQSPDDVESIESQVKLVGDVAGPYGLNPITVEGVALVTSLAGTGSDPAPSIERSALVEDMQTRGVINPNSLLASNNTSLVLVRAHIPPGAMKDDRIDVEVRLPPLSETNSLRGGWLMQTRMQEILMVNSQIREGHLMALAEGPLFVEPATDKDEKVLLKRAKVLGGAIVRDDRNFGLLLKDEARPNLATGVRISSQIGTAINKRFHRVVRGTKEGIATPKTDGYIELAMHPRYKDNIPRFLRVVRAIPLYERPAEQLARLELLERQLLNPVTSAAAAIRLEAVGKPAIKTLEKGLQSDDPEVRFYSAEALGYLDEAIAAKVLGQAAREERAFRAFALAALSAMNDLTAEEELRLLLDSNSSETRYGAFRALHAMNKRHPAVRGENLGGQFSYHVVKSTAPAMVHVTRSKRPEVVLFGADQRLLTPLALQAGNSIQVTAASNDRITVSKFAVGQPDQRRTVSTSVDEVIRAIVDVGGSYPDVVDALQQAKALQALPSRFEVESIAEFYRTYDRRSDEENDGNADEDGAQGGEDEPGYVVSNPLPSLFSQKGKSGN